MAPAGLDRDSIALVAKQPTRVLIISRRTGRHMFHRTVPLDVLGRDEAVEMLTRILTHGDPAVDVAPTDVATVCDPLIDRGQVRLKLDCHPPIVLRAGRARQHSPPARCQLLHRLVHATTHRSAAGRPAGPE